MSSPNPTVGWLARAEEGLFAVAMNLRCVPLSPQTKHLHLRALSLKREIKRARASSDLACGPRLLAEVETLGGEVRRALPRVPPRFTPRSGAAVTMECRERS